MPFNTFSLIRVDGASRKSKNTQESALKTSTPTLQGRAATTPARTLKVLVAGQARPGFSTTNSLSQKPIWLVDWRFFYILLKIVRRQKGKSFKTVSTSFQKALGARKEKRES